MVGPCPNGWAALRAVSAPAQESEQIAEIALDGSLRFPGVLPGRYALSIHCLGCSPRGGPELLEVASAPLGELRWQVVRGTTLRVRVLDARATRIAFAPLVLRKPDRGDGWGRRTTARMPEESCRSPA